MRRLFQLFCNAVLGTTLRGLVAAAQWYVGDMDEAPARRPR